MVEKFPNMLTGTQNIDHKTSSTKIILKSIMELYEKIINKNLLVRRINITANNVTSVLNYDGQRSYEQIDLFNDYKKNEAIYEKEIQERNLQKAVLQIKSKYGKNAIIKGMNLEKAGTTIERNSQVGGHKA